MQDRSITHIGAIARESLHNLAPYQFYVEDMFPGREYSMLLGVFEIREIEEVCQATFVGPDIDRVSQTSFMRYLYRKGSSRGGDITVTTKAGDLGKKLGNFLRPQLAAAHALAQELGLAGETAMLGALRACIEEDFYRISTELVAEYEAIDKKERQIMGFSLQLKVGGETKHLEDFEVFRRQILNSGVEGKKEKYGVRSFAADEVCAVCLEKQPEVMGFASPFKFATVDKPGMVAGFFDQRANWKNYPVCADCALDFELGQKYVAENLRKIFYGLSYFMIPKPIVPGDMKSLRKAIKLLEGIDYREAVSKGSTITRREDYVMQQLGGSDNTFSLSLLFFEENMTTKAMSIKLMLEEILPSRFRRLFIDAPARVNAYTWYQGLPTGKAKGDTYDLRFSFGLIKEFFSDDFYGMIQRVFKGEAISASYLWGRFMAVIRNYYTEDKLSYVTILKAHLLLHYFSELGLMYVSSDQFINLMAETQETATADKKPQKRSFDREKLEAFIQENPGFFDEPYKQGVFAVGILVRLLLNVQYRTMNGNTPFAKKLKGLNLNRDSLMAIYVEALNKLSQYKFQDSNFFISVYAGLRDFINDHFSLQVHEMARISNNELSFYFVAGLEMGTKFKLGEEEEVEGPEEQN